MKNLDQIRFLSIIHPVIMPSEGKPEKCLAVFEYAIHGDEKKGEINIHTLDNIQILPSQEEMEALGLSYIKQIRPNSDSIYLRNENPLYIKDTGHLIALQEMLVDILTKLLQYSPPSRQ